MIWRSWRRHRKHSAVASEIQQAATNYIYAFTGSQGTACTEAKTFLDDAIQPKGGRTRS